VGAALAAVAEIKSNRKERKDRKDRKKVGFRSIHTLGGWRRLDSDPRLRGILFAFFAFFAFFAPLRETLPAMESQ
jgi:hypothetical protein